MAPNIGFPYDPVKLAKQKEQTLNNLLSSRARAWHAYFDTMSIAYESAHSQHAKTLNEIKQSLIDKQAFLKEILFGSLIPSMIGGGMSNLVANGGDSMFKELLPVATKFRASLINFAEGATKFDVEDVIKIEVTKALGSLVPAPGSEWDAVGDTPLKFFLQLNRMVDQYTTDVTHSVELKKATVQSMDELDDYIDVLNAHLLSPFITKAPMDKDRYYHETELAPVYEIFLWVHWARERDTKYWNAQLSLAQKPDDRNMVEKVWDGVMLDDDAIAYVNAKEALKDLDPILERLRQCGIQQTEVSDQAVWDPDRRILNIFWVRMLGARHNGTLLSDLVSNLDAKVPTSAFDDKVIDQSRSLK